MTDPNDLEPRPDHLPDVDAVIHEARESSWHLPETPPGEVHSANPEAATTPEAARTLVGVPKPDPRRATKGEGEHVAPSSGGASSGSAHGDATSAHSATEAAQMATQAHRPAGQGTTPVQAASADDGATPAQSTSADPVTSHHATPDHATPGHATPDHGSGHGGTHKAEAVGPLDIEMWGAGILAAAVALFMTVCFVLATAGAGAY